MASKEQIAELGSLRALVRSMEMIIDDKRARIAALESERDQLATAAHCPACGCSLLTDHDLDCPHWGKPEKSK